MSSGSQAILFAFQLMTLMSAVLVAFHPNILYASVALLFTFLGVACMFIFIGADFLAGAQVIVYVGGITILILFAIMLTQWMYKATLRDVRTKILLPVVACGLLVTPILLKTTRLIADLGPLGTAETMTAFSFSPKTQVIGQALLTSYVLPFEAVTILLLGALVGAVWLARPQ